MASNNVKILRLLQHSNTMRTTSEIELYLKEHYDDVETLLLELEARELICSCEVAWNEELNWSLTILGTTACILLDKHNPPRLCFITDQIEEARKRMVGE